MIRKLDNLWLRLLGVLYCGALRRVQAHFHRDKWRRLKRHLASQRSELN